jgi:hypothetical protein
VGRGRVIFCFMTGVINGLLRPGTERLNANGNGISSRTSNNVTCDNSCSNFSFFFFFFFFHPRRVYFRHTPNTQKIGCPVAVPQR